MCRALNNRGPNCHRRGRGHQGYGATDPSPADGEPGRDGYAGGRARPAGTVPSMRHS